MDYMAAQMDSQIDGAISENERLRQECEALRKDAERYRWLKHKAPGEIVFDHINDDHRFELYVPFDGNPIDNDEQSNARLDAAIDAAMQAGVFGAA